jgi:hypothetical protein
MDEDFGGCDFYDGDDLAAYNANEADDYRNEGDENEPTGYEVDDFSPLGEEF